MSVHTNHIVRRWDTALPGSWIALLLNEEMVALDQWYLNPLSANHGKCRGNAPMDSKNKHVECVGHGDGLFHDSWRGVERYERYSGSGSPTIGPGVRSSAPSPEERLDLETAVCPRGRSHSSRYWPGTASDWMSSMSLIRYFPLKVHVFWFPLRELFLKTKLWYTPSSFCSSNLILTEASFLSSTYYQEKAPEMFLR